eukprot:435469-Prymnesium_polylepis.3
MFISSLSSIIFAQHLGASMSRKNCAVDCTVARSPGGPMRRVRIPVDQHFEKLWVVQVCRRKGH